MFILMAFVFVSISLWSIFFSVDPLTIYLFQLLFDYDICYYMLNCSINRFLHLWELDMVVLILKILTKLQSIKIGAINTFRARLLKLMSRHLKTKKKWKERKRAAWLPAINWQGVRMHTTSHPVPPVNKLNLFS